MVNGVLTALITPFKDGMVDDVAFERLVEWQIAQGVHGLVPCGTTGESPTLDHDEHNHVIERCVKVANKRVPVMAGTGSNATSEAVTMSQHAENVGADAVLIASPYYNKPTPEGIYQHYKAIHDAIRVPVYIYNIPGRSVVNLSDELIARLAELPRMAGIKDATGDLARPLSLRQKLGKRRDSFIQLSGEDATALPFNLQGGQGCISVTSNIAPKLCAELQELWFKGDIKSAQSLNDRLEPLHQVMFCETSPGPVKYAASQMGLCTEEMRLPLVPPSEESQRKIRAVLESLGLL